MRALLYGDPSPSLRWRTAVELDGADERDGDVEAWRAEIGDSPSVRALLEQLDSVAAADPSAAGYLLCQLAYLGHRGPELADAVEAIFAAQQPDGSWPPGLADEASAQRGEQARNATSRPPTE